MTDLSRRQFFAASGAAAAAIWITAESRDLLAAGMHAAQATRFENLSPADAADIEATTAQIIPTDATPGAREARVVYFIDNALGTFAKTEKPAFDAAVKELRARAAKAKKGAKSFAELSGTQQISVLTALEKEKPEMFGQLRSATVAGMLANPEYGGNFNKTGWKMIGFVDQFSWAPPFGWYDKNA